LRLIPLRCRKLVTAEELLKCLRVDVKRLVKADLALDGFDDCVGDSGALIPVGLEPLLELRDLASTLHLDVELDVLREAGGGEVAGADECLGANDRELCVRDVGLRMELVAVIDATVNLPGLERFKDRRNPPQEGVLGLLPFDAVVEHLDGLGLHNLQQRLASPIAHVGTHQDPDLV
jgi:hypothetical protein